MQQLKMDTAGLIDGEIPDANDVLVALIDLKTHLENSLNGVQAFDLMNFGPAEALTISAGAVTLTKSHITLAGQGAAADDLDTISGGAEGDVVLIRNSTDSYAITLKHATGNLRTATAVDIVLSDTNAWAIGVKTATNWLLGALIRANTRERLSSTLLNTSKFKVPDRTSKAAGSNRRLAYWPSAEAGSSFGVRASNPNIAALGIAAPTIAAPGTSSYGLVTAGPYFIMGTAASPGSAAGLISTTFNLVWAGWNPTLVCLAAIANPLTDLRAWIGLCGAAPANAEAAGTSFAGFRFSTVAPDTGWTPVLNDGTQNVGSSMNTMNGNEHLLSLRVDSTEGAAYFSVDGGDEQKLTANIPLPTTDLGFVVRLFAVANAARIVVFHRLEVQMK